MATKNSNDKTVVLSKADVKRETEKAFLFRIDLAYKKMYMNAEVWIAKSICKVDGDRILVPFWAIKKSDAARTFLSAMCASHKAHLLKVFPYGTFDDE